MGSIPTRSRAAVRAMAAPVALACVLGSYAFIPRALSAQETDPPAQAATDSLAADPIALDELGAEVDAVESLAGDSVAAEVTESRAGPESIAPATSQPAPADSAGPLPPVSPMGAFFRSLVLPGWGQVSVDQPGRGAFYFAMEAGSLWMLLKTNAKLNAAKRSNPLDQDLIDAREAQFEDWATLAVFWALFAGVDAWVSAQLWDFKGEVVPPPDGSPGAAFQYSVPVGP